jgi:hypothetical protein
MERSSLAPEKSRAEPSSAAEFYSTLSQVCTTALALLVAALVGYSVFVKERTAQMDEKIDQDRVEIRRLLLTGFTKTWLFDKHVPPGFERRFRSRYAAESEAELVIEATGDTIFNQNVVKQLDKGEGAWRAYYWTLALGIKLITRGHALDSTVIVLKGKPRQTTGPTDAFPLDPHGTGFEEWRHDFEEVSKAFTVLAGYNHIFTAQGIRSFGATRLGRKAFADHFMDADRVFAQVGSVKGLLDDIDAQLLMKRRYSAAVFGRRSAVWILLASGLGILFPLLALAFNAGGRPWLQAVIALLATASVVGASLNVGYTLFRR